MQLAGWLDVALEGGVTELQRGLGTYQELRALLEGEWRTRAGAVAAASARAKVRCFAVEEALDRAQRRVRQDAAAAPVGQLAQRVEQERDALLARLAVLHGEAAPVASQLDWLHATASEEAWFESSVRRFHVERAGWTSLVLGLFLAIPWSAWQRASWGGRLGTILSLEGLGEPVVWLMTGAALLAVVTCWVRVGHWHWLGLRAPRALTPVVFGLWGGAAGATFFASVITQNPVPFVASALVSTLIGAVLVMRSLWSRRSFTPQVR